MWFAVILLLQVAFYVLSLVFSYVLILANLAEIYKTGITEVRCASAPCHICTLVVRVLNFSAADITLQLLNPNFDSAFSPSTPFPLPFPLPFIFLFSFLVPL